MCGLYNTALQDLAHIECLCLNNRLQFCMHLRVSVACISMTNFLQKAALKDVKTKRSELFSGRWYSFNPTDVATELKYYDHLLPTATTLTFVTKQKVCSSAHFCETHCSCGHYFIFIIIFFTFKNSVLPTAPFTIFQLCSCDLNFLVIPASSIDHRTTPKNGLQKPQQAPAALQLFFPCLRLSTYL